MKKISSYLAVVSGCMVALFLLVGCGQEQGHEHSYNIWSADAQNHWHTCSECDEKLDLGKHTLDEESMCSVCKSAVYSNEDGSKSVYIYDEHGHVAIQEDYDAQGTITYRQRFEIEYYEDGCIKHSKEYVYDILLNKDGEEVLSSETTFLHCENPENGEVYMSESIDYNDDGTKQICKYNEQSNLLLVTIYDASGNVTTVERYEYEYDDNGKCVKQATYVNDVISREIFYAYDEEGNEYESKQIYYDENGKKEKEYKYDAHGNEIK